MVCLGPSLVSRGRRSSARNTAIQDHCRRPKFFHRQNIFIERLERRIDIKQKQKTIQEMQIFVKTPTGQTLTFDVEASITISGLKKLIKKKLKVRVVDQVLVNVLDADTSLDDPFTLEQNDVKNKDTLELFIVVEPNETETDEGDLIPRAPITTTEDSS